MQTSGEPSHAIRQVALQQSDVIRAQFMATVSVYDPRMLIYGLTKAAEIGATQCVSMLTASEEYQCAITGYFENSNVEPPTTNSLSSLD
jgi:hypothetical protein